MKEYIIKKKSNNEQEIGYNLQKIDIKMLIDLGIDVPDKFRKIYKNGFTESELKEFIYFNDPNSVEYIRTQTILRDYIEFSNLNSFELDLLIFKYKEKIENINNLIKYFKNKEDLLNLEYRVKILTSEMQSLIYLKDDVIKEENKRK